MSRSRPTEVAQAIASENPNPWSQYEVVHQRNPATTGAASSSSGSGLAIHFDELRIVSPDVSQSIVDKADFSRSRSPYGPDEVRKLPSDILAQSLAAYKELVRQEKALTHRNVLLRPKKDSDCGNWVHPRILK